MEYLKIPPNVKEAVRTYIKKTNLPREQQGEQVQFIECIRKGLQHTVNFQTNQKIIVDEYVIQKTHLYMLCMGLQNLNSDRVSESIPVSSILFSPLQGRGPIQKARGLHLKQP